MEETEGVLLWLLSPLGGTAAMISAYLNDLPWYQILFWGTGVFAFLMHGLFQAWQWRQRTTVFEKLHLKLVHVANIQFAEQDSPTIDIGMRFRFHNAADVPVYFLLMRGNISIEGIVRPDARVDNHVFLIQPHSDHFVLTPLIQGIEKKEALLGNADFSVAYGPSRDKLRYVLENEGQLMISLVPDPNNPRGFHVNSTMRHHRLSHSIRQLSDGS